MTPEERAERQRQVNIARANGIVFPMMTWTAAQEVDVPFAVACAFLEQETAGGDNVWGHDGTWMIGYPVMNEDVYNVYKAHRSRFGLQGVGPMQLTWGPFQDRADAAGGCWLSGPNIRVGMQILRELFDDKLGGTWRNVARLYNGSDTYADQVFVRIHAWRGLLA